MIPFPLVVVELVLGIIIGPQVLGLAELDDLASFFGSLGLAFLFLFAGYEIEFDRIRGTPLRLALIGWAISLVLAYSLAGVLHATGLIVSGLLVGSAMATTAIGTLMPILRDNRLLETHFGRLLLAAGAVGELGPILIITLLLSGDSDELVNALILAGFVLLTIVTAAVALQAPDRFWHHVRGLDAHERAAPGAAHGRPADRARRAGRGVRARPDPGRVRRRRHRQPGAAPADRRRATTPARRSRSSSTPSATGSRSRPSSSRAGWPSTSTPCSTTPGRCSRCRCSSCSSSSSAGLPALLLYRDVLPAARERAALALFSATQLPLVVAITTIGVQTDRMHAATAAALVGAAMLSTLLYPLVGTHLARYARTA